MAEPTSALTFEGLILRVAREAGIAYYGSGGNEPAMIPVDRDDFDKCKQIVNDGIRMFIADAPPQGWRWMHRIMSVTFTATRETGIGDAGTNATHLIDATLITTYDTADDLKDWYAYILTGTGAGSYAQITAYDETTGDCTVADWLDAYGNPGGTDPTTGSTFAITPVETVGGDIARYPLSENFGGETSGEIHYTSGTGHANIIDWRDEGLIRARRAVSVNTGYPAVAAIRPLEYYSGGYGPKRRFELIVDPQPVAADTVEFPYPLFFDNLRMVTGESSAGDSTSLTDSDLIDLYPDNYFNDDWKIKIIGGTGKNSYAIVTDYDSATGAFTVADWLDISGGAGGKDPSANSAYIVEPTANLHPAGFRFDQAILAACLARTEMEVEDVTAGWVEKYYKSDLPKAYATDVRSAPRKLGPMGPPAQHLRGRWRGRSDVTTDHDI